MKKIKLALTGIGGYGSYYTSYFLDQLDTDSCEWAGAIDPFAQSAPDYPRIAERGVPVYASMEDFYREKTADLMVISTPIHLHSQQSETAVRHGSAVLCEKPPAPTLRDALEMKRLEEQYQRPIFIGFQLSFASSNLRLKQDILSGRFGRLKRAKTIVLWERDFTYYNRGVHWAGRRCDEQGHPIHDSVASNATAHYLHNLLFLLGDRMETAASPIRIEGSCLRANPIETFDTCALKLTLSSQAELLYLVSHATKGNVQPKYEIEFERATVFWDSADERGIHAQTHEGESISYGGAGEAEKVLEDHEKISRIIDYLCETGAPKPPCTVETTLPFSACIQTLFDDFAFRSVPKDCIVFDPEKQRVWVNGLYEKMVGCYEEGRLFDHI